MVGIERLRVIPQLDSFRFFAVLLVIISHWVPNNKINLIPNGYIGVYFFFVLSGFLISANLLIQKNAILQGKSSFGRELKIFYARRTLRIFPLYFFVILAIYLLNSFIFQGKVLWYLFYLPNILMFKTNYWPESLSHFWSLGVEEQFYLICPFFIFWIRFDRVKFFFAGLIVVSILFKMFFFINASPDTSLYSVLPFSCFDAFGLGGFLAYLVVTGNKYVNKISKDFYWPGLSVCFIVAVLVYIWSGIAPIFGLLISGISFFLIARSYTGYKGFAGWILDNRIFRYLGKISYGLYVYHNFMPWLWRCITGREDKFTLPFHGIKIAWLNRPVVLLSAQFLMLIIISSLSWFLLEKRFIELKKFVR